MDPDHPTQVESPTHSGAEFRVDADLLWNACVQWAHLPREGIRLPMDIAAQIARSAMDAAIDELPRHASQVEITAFCQRRTRNLALARVALERQRQENGALWHENGARGEEPAIDLHRLKLNDNAAWQTAMPALRQLVTNNVRCRGLSAEDAEDLFAEALAAVVQSAEGSPRPIDELQVAEQLPGLMTVIAQRRAADLHRRRSAQKRNVALEVAVDGEDEFHVPNEGGDPLARLDLCDILEQSAHAVSPAEWEVIIRLIIHRTDTHASLISDARLMGSLSIDPRSSEATRRRRLHEALAHALSKIRRQLDLPK